MNWAEIIVGTIISAMVGLLLDEIILRGKARMAVKRSIKYLTIGKWKVGDGSVIKGD